MKRLGRDLPRFHALGAEVLGVSYDDSATQGKFAVHCAAAFPFLSDEKGEVAARYLSNGNFGPVHFAERRTFLIDRAGIIREVYDGMPDDERILADLSKVSGTRGVPSAAPRRSPRGKQG